MSAPRIAPATLKAWLRDGAELAILDAREEGEFAAAHLFWAVPCPLSVAELRAPGLLPERRARAREPGQHHRVEPGDVHTELQGVRRGDAQQLPRGQGRLQGAALLGQVAAPVGLDPGGQLRRDVGDLPPGAQDVVGIQHSLDGQAWRDLETITVTNARGFFTARVAVPAGGQLRATYPGTSITSLPDEP